MKLNQKTYLLASIFAIYTLQSCKPEEKVAVPAESNEQIYSKNQTADNSNVESSVDEVMNSIDDQIGNTGARLEECGITNTTITGTKKSYKFNFTATSCSGVLSKSGEVILTLESGNKFSDAGSVWKKQYKNIVVTTKENKTITLNGDVYLTNVSGGFPVRIFVLPNEPVIHRVKSNNLTIKLDTTTSTRQWNIARKYTWTNVSNTVTLSVEGDTIIGSYSKLILWGKNRFGQDFYSQLKTPAVFGLTCKSRPITATRTNTIERKEGNITSEETVTTSATCLTTYSVTVTAGTKTYTYTQSF